MATAHAQFGQDPTTMDSQARESRALTAADFGRCVPARRAPADSWISDRKWPRGVMVPVTAEEPSGTSVRVYRVGRRLGVLT